MALVEGLKDAVDAEMDRIRKELRRALDASPHTYAEIASMAGVDASNIYRFLAGTTAMKNDTLTRVALIAGARLMIDTGTNDAEEDSDASPGGEAEPPFRLVRNEQASSSDSQSSTSTTSSVTSLQPRQKKSKSRSASLGTRDNVANAAGTTAKKRVNQQGRSSSPKRTNKPYAHQVVYLRKHNSVFRLDGQNLAKTG